MHVIETIASSQMSRHSSPIDMDAWDDAHPMRSTSLHKQCQGFKPDLPLGRTPHSSYPFGLHDQLNDPWDYSVTNGVLVLRSRKCTPDVTLDSEEHCQHCRSLMEDANIQGILRRMEIGVQS